LAFQWLMNFQMRPFRLLAFLLFVPSCIQCRVLVVWQPSEHHDSPLSHAQVRSRTIDEKDAHGTAVMDRSICAITASCSDDNDKGGGQRVDSGALDTTHLRRRETTRTVLEASFSVLTRLHIRTTSTSGDAASPFQTSVPLESTGLTSIHLVIIGVISATISFSLACLAIYAWNRRTRIVGFLGESGKRQYTKLTHMLVDTHPPSPPPKPLELSLEAKTMMTTVPRRKPLPKRRPAPDLKTSFILSPIELPATPVSFSAWSKRYSSRFSWVTSPKQAFTPHKRPFEVLKVPPIYEDY
jgi:hypothetical protein